MAIATSQYRDARRPCRSSTGHNVACAVPQFEPLWKGLLSINASLFDRDHLIEHRSGIDQRARLTCHNASTPSAALKSP